MPPTFAKTKWRGRPAFCLSNGVVQLITLSGGGHIADFRLVDLAGNSVNALWEAPWPTMDPAKFRKNHVRKYGPPAVGKFLASFTGHAVCVDYFGGPSEAEAAQGLALHGEAANLRWKLQHSGHSRVDTQLSMAVRLPASGLRLCREIRLRKGECAVYVEETLTNERAQDHFFHWTQHVTLGLPLLQVSESVITLPGTRAITWPHGYEGVSLLRDDKEFTWPEAPAIGGGKVNLAHPFSEDGKGFVAGVLLDLQRELGFVSALNWRLGLLLGYCFRRTDFPWVAIWEENVARQGSPWNGKTRARGLEFGTTPMPVGKEETFLRGTLFDMPTFRRIPARSKLRVPYVAFLTKVSSSWRSIRDIQVERERIIVTEGRGEQLQLRATGLKKLGLA